MERGLTAFNRIGLTLQVAKTALATGLSWWIASMLSLNHYPYFAALGAIFTVQVTIMDSIQKAVQRIIGIIGGVIISMLIGHWLPLDAGSITLVVLIGMALSTALRLSPPITSQVAVSSLLVLAFGNTPGYAVGRIIETIIGCFIAVIVNIVIVPPNAIPKAEQQILQLGARADAVLRDLAFAYHEQILSAVDLPYVQELVDQTEQSFQAVQLAQQSLRYSPLLKNRQSRLVQVLKAISRFEHITIQIRGIARGLVDLGHQNEPLLSLVQAIDTTAPCVSWFGERMVNPSDDFLQPLQDAVAQARVHQATCLMDFEKLDSLTTMREIGAILTDLHRILVEVTDGPLVVTGREFHAH